MGDKSAFPWLFDGPEGMDFSEGMTYREWQWTQFAVNPPECHEQWLKDSYGEGQTRLEALRDWAIAYADAMMAAIAERESK